MLSRKEELRNIKELEYSILQQILSSEEITNAINLINPDLYSEIIMLTAAVKYQDEVWIEIRDNEWCVILRATEKPKVKPKRKAFISSIEKKDNRPTKRFKPQQSGH